MEVEVLIVGAGPSGIGTSACLNRHSIANIVLEREDCYASLWKKRTYDRMSLHIGKQFCELPHMPHPSDASTFLSKSCFLSYLNTYMNRFDVMPRYNRHVVSASFDTNVGKWRVEAKNTLSGVGEVYVGRFLVVASGENGEGWVPNNVPGLSSFGGELMHSGRYKNGRDYHGRNVLVVGCGNSGMEIALDLSNWGASTSIVARSPVHVLSRQMVLLGMLLCNYLPCNVLDYILVTLSKLKYGYISNYGLRRPTEGPFFLKKATGRSPTIDVGCMKKIERGEIQVFPSITGVEGNKIGFANGQTGHFDAIVFATGYRSTVRKWLQGGEDLLNENGMPTRSCPNHWKGENGLYCAGFSRSGLFGISKDAKCIAEDINHIIGGI